MVFESEVYGNEVMDVALDDIKVSTTPCNEPGTSFLDAGTVYKIMMVFSQLGQNTKIPTHIVV